MKSQTPKIKSLPRTQFKTTKNNNFSQQESKSMFYIMNRIEPKKSRSKKQRFGIKGTTLTEKVEGAPS